MRPKSDTLTSQELEIMKVIWPLGRATVREVYDLLRERRTIAYTTVQTMMNILETKGHLKREPGAKASVYAPIRPQQAVVGSMVREFVNRVFDGSTRPLLVHLLKDKGLTEREKRELEKLLNKGGQMTAYLWNLAAYSIQLAALAGVAVAATWLLGDRVPRLSLRFWQLVMAIALLLPFAQPQGGGELLRLIVQSDPVTAATTAGAALNPTTVDVATMLMILLAAGIAVRLLWLAAGMIRLRAIVRHSAPDAALDQTSAELSCSLRTSAAIRVCSNVEGPATIGVFRPMILVPHAVLAMPAAVQRAILCHELLHVKRRDWLHTIAEEIWCAALWFHPGARALASRLSLAREMVVDEQTILTTRDRRAYAEALLAFSDPQPHVIGATPFIGRRTLSQRISLIAEETPMPRYRALTGLAIALVAVLGSTATAVNRFPMSGALPGQEQIYEPGPGRTIPGLTLPSVTREVKPSYTPEAMEKKIQGSVWLKIVVDPKGDVTEVIVTRSLDAEYGLDQAAMKAAWLWKFKPGMKDGQPVAVRVTLELTFTLKK